MKVSKYLIFINNYVFSSLTGSIIKLDNEKVEALYRENLSIFSNEELKSLKKMSYIVDFDEEKYIVEQEEKNNSMRLTLMVNMQCNFRCKYCYETKENKKMSRESYDKILKFISSKNNLNKLRIDFFGGEPLLSYDDIVYFLEKLNSIILEKNIELECAITTNFYLIDNTKFSKLIDLGVKEYQVTIDGLANTHNFYRPLVNGNGSFDVVMTNVLNTRNVDKNFKFFIRVNYDNHTDYSEYINFLKENFQNDNRYIFLTNPIQDYDLKNREYVCNKDDGLIKGDLLNTYAKNVGLNIFFDDKIYSSFLPCYATSKNTFIINYDLKIKKCSILLYDDINYVGDLGDNKLNDNYWTKYKFNDCNECKAFPICLGQACKLEKFENKDECFNKKYEEFKLNVIRKYGE